MEDQLVSFETAKLAKEGGFNIRQDNAYFETLQHTLDIPRSGEMTFDYQPPRALTSTYHESDEHTIKICEAPTQSSLQKWFREEHNIQMFMKPFYNSLKHKGTFSCDVIRISDGRVLQSEREDTYEIALELGLQKAITLLKTND